MSDPYLTVVIPAYNEQRRLPPTVRAVLAHARERGWSVEVLVVDDGSTDGTARVTEELAREDPAVRLLALSPNQGKGAAVRAGMLAAQGQYVLFSDADQSTPIAEVDGLLAKLERDGYDLAIGSRAAAGAAVSRSQAWYRKWAGDFFGWATRLLVVRGVADTQCGFKVLTRATAQRVFPQVRSDTAIFDIELLAVAAREGCRVAEVPVRWAHDPETRLPYDWRRAIAIWCELFRIRRRQRIGWPPRVRGGAEESHGT